MHCTFVDELVRRVRVSFIAPAIVVCLFGVATNAHAVTSDCVSMRSDGYMYGGSLFTKVRPYGITTMRSVLEDNTHISIAYMKSDDEILIKANVRVTSDCGMLTPRVEIDMPPGFSYDNLLVTEHSYNPDTKQSKYAIKYTVFSEAILQDKHRDLMAVNFVFDFEDKSGFVDRYMYLEIDDTPPAPLRADEFTVTPDGSGYTFELVNKNQFLKNRDDGSFMAVINWYNKKHAYQLRPWYICSGGGCGQMYRGTYEFLIRDEVGNVSAPVSYRIPNDAGGTDDSSGGGGKNTDKGNNGKGPNK